MLRIGDGWDELLEVVRQSSVEACWDFGHAYMNHVRLGRPLDPPDGLLSHVAHVHCHDVDREDHQPLVFGKVPWERLLGRLAACGFDGTVILEVPAEHFLAAGGLESLVRSVGELKRVVA